jgi:VWFA-related protein
MTRPLVAFVACVAILGSGAVVGLRVHAQASQGTVPEFRAGTAVVILDVIARDKKGRPVRDLKAEELQVFENDQRCELKSFRRVESEATIEPGAGAVSAPVEPAAAGGAPAPGKRAPFNLVTLVFDRMSLEDNRLAEKAARDFVERGMDARTQAAVFTIGSQLGLVQPFTSEKEPLLAAIALATSGKNLKDPSLTAQAQQASRDVAMASGLPVGGALPETGDATQPASERVTALRAANPGSRSTRAVPISSTGSHARCAWRTASSGRWKESGRSIPCSRW